MNLERTERRLINNAFKALNRLSNFYEDQGSRRLVRMYEVNRLLRVVWNWQVGMPTPEVKRRIAKKIYAGLRDTPPQ